MRGAERGSLHVDVMTKNNEGVADEARGVTAKRSQTAAPDGDGRPTKRRDGEYFGLFLRGEETPSTSRRGDALRMLPAR